MSTKSEAFIQQEVINKLLLHGWAVMRINGMNVSGVRSYLCYPSMPTIVKGAADIIAMHGSTCILVEVKTLNGKLSVDQMRYQKWCLAYGLDYRVITDADELTVEDFSSERIIKPRKARP